MKRFLEFIYDSIIDVPDELFIRHVFSSSYLRFSGVISVLSCICAFYSVNLAIYVALLAILFRLSED